MPTRKNSENSNHGIILVCLRHMLLSYNAMISNSFGTSTCVSTIRSLSCSIVPMPYSLITKSGFDIVINSSLVLVDNDDYDEINHLYFSRSDKKNNNNDTTT